MHPEKIKFSKTALDLIKPQKKGIYYFDEEVSGLAVRVLPSGFKTCYLYKRLKGKDYEKVNDYNWASRHQQKSFVSL